MKERTLQDVKVGDLVGPERHGGPNAGQWTGVLHTVSKVGAKRFSVGSTWYSKETGFAVVSGSSYHMIPATPEMIAKHRAKQTAAQEAEDTLKAFHARPDYRDASAIHFLLDQMSPGEHPLDKLTPAEWAEFRRKLEV